MKTGIKMNTLQSIYKKCRYVINMHRLSVVMEKKKKNTTSVLADCVDSCSPSCPVSSLSPCEPCLKSQ